jgi:ADP-ribose pyrophosphatase YjhB (NUDIX family)
VVDDKKRVLLQRRTDDSTWSIPGRAIDLEETLEKAAKREVFEETNLTVSDLKLFNVYSGEEQHWIYPDGNEVYFINTVFITNKFQGVIKADGIEGDEVKFFDMNNLPEKITPSNMPFIRELKSRIGL